ncbi:MAG: cysteine hydrolase family protein [Pseudomonadota bacterium]
MTKRAVIAIDIQNDYFPGGKWALEGIDGAADNAARLIAAARQSGDTIVHVRHEFQSADAPFFAPGTEGAKVHQKVLPAEGEHQVLKHSVNAFQGTDLKALLEQEGVEELVVCGAMSHMCIDAAVRAGKDFGFTCTVAQDACATRDLEFEGKVIPAAQVHAAYMSALGFAYAQVVTTETVLGG